MGRLPIDAELTNKMKLTYKQETQLHVETNTTKVW